MFISIFSDFSTFYQVQSHRHGTDLLCVSLMNYWWVFELAIIPEGAQDYGLVRAVLLPRGTVTNYTTRNMWLDIKYICLSVSVSHLNPEPFQVITAALDSSQVMFTAAPDPSKVMFTTVPDSPQILSTTAPEPSQIMLPTHLVWLMLYYRRTSSASRVILCVCYVTLLE